MLLVVAAGPAHARLLSPRGDTSAVDGVSAVRPLALDRTALAELRAEHHALVRDFPIGDARIGDLVLDRFEPFTPDARAEIMEAGGPRGLVLPDDVYFRGRVDGDPTSLAFVVAGHREAHGFVIADGQVFPFGPDAHGNHRAYALANADPERHPPPRDFCANDLDPEAVAIPQDEIARIAALPVAAATTGTIKQADIAIETDRELRTKFTSDTAALQYLASLAAAATAIYERDVAVRLRFSYIRLWGTSPADPYAATDPSGTLAELRSYWNNAANGMAQIAGPRTAVHMISGKPVQGGVAYLNVLCSQSYGYGVSQVFGSFDLANPSNVWDVVVVTHELGHNFGSPHTHCYSPPIDRCYNGEAGCYSGSVVASRGTIMSYCHLLGGGLANLDLLFGDTVSSRIGQSVAGASCLATVPTDSTTTTSSTTTSSTSTSTSTRPTTTSSSTSTSTSSSTSSSTSTSTSSSTSTTKLSSTTSTSSTTTSSTSTSTTTRPLTTSSTSSSTSTTKLPSTTTTSSSSTSTLVPTTTTRPPTTTTTSTSIATTSSTSSSTSTTTLPGDLDADGVVGNVDVCPATPAGDFVDPSGCTLCPCAGPDGTGWARGAYVRCVRDAIDQSGAFDPSKRRTMLRDARRSSCGRANATRCCVYGSVIALQGRCRIVTKPDCAARTDAGRAADFGPGTCPALSCTR